MPYSDSHRYVHIRVPKTGSSSVSKLLSDFHKTNGGERFLVSDLVNRDFRKQYTLNQIGDRNPKRAGHLSALQFRHILGKKYESYFSFSFVRNPWSRMVSRYHYTLIDNYPSKEEIEMKRARGDPGPLRKFHNKEFDQWLAQVHFYNKIKSFSFNFHRRLEDNQINKLCDKHKNIIVDFIGKLENFESDLSYVCERIGISLESVPNKNKTRHKHYTEYYNDRTRRMVEEMCKYDIEHFNYKFGD